MHFEMLMNPQLDIYQKFSQCHIMIQTKQILGFEIVVIRNKNMFSFFWIRIKWTNEKI